MFAYLAITRGDKNYPRLCEAMVKLITHTSALKGDDCRLKRLPFGSKMCIQCELGSIEDALYA